MTDFERIDLNTWKRRHTFEWFSSFSDSSYGMDADVDVTNVLKYAKEKKCSFFLCMTYAVSRAMNSVPELRMRLRNGEPVIYSKINPAHTVLDGDEVITNARHRDSDDLEEYLRLGREAVEKAVSGALQDGDYNPEKVTNDYYFTSVPWVNFRAITHAMPDDKDNQTIPRICFGKYHEENGRYLLTLNITVSHMFVDGLALARVFLRAQENMNRFPDCSRTD